MTPSSNRIGRRIEGLVLLVAGVAAGLFAVGGDYGRLLNPAYRPLTLLGGILVGGMGLAALWMPPSRPPRGALGVALAFLALVGVGALVAPPVGDTAALFARPGPGQGALLPAGYERASLGDLYRALQREATSPPGDAPLALAGVVVRPPDVEARGEYVLLEAQMACCLADAIAVGFRVRPQQGALPDEGTWVYAYGRLETEPAAVVVAPFHYGVLRWITLEGDHVLAGDGWVPVRSTFASVRGRLDQEGTRRFLTRLEAADVAEALDGEGPFTVFVPVEVAMPPAVAPFDARVHVVRGRHPRAALFRTRTLEALDGTAVPVENRNGTLWVGGARILFTEEDLRNGVLHHVHRPLRGDAR